MKKVRIIIYDDMGIMLDDTEVISGNKEQIQKIAESMLKTTNNAEYSEVWNDKRIKMKFSLTSKGRIKSVTNVEHPNWGGVRAGQGRPSLGAKAYRHRIPINVNDEMLGRLENLNNRASWIRQAIQEKLDREDNIHSNKTL